MNRIDARFAALRTRGQKGFIAYICAGDPNLSATAGFARHFERAGVDVLELGVPFSDPLADGLVNQLAAERALRSGTTVDGVLKTVADLRRGGSEIPIVLYIYYNLVHRRGVNRFATDAAAAGVDGVLALDLPPEEAGEYERAMRQNGLCPIYLVAPTTPAARIREICRHASGFVYYVSREGVTGMRKTLPAALASKVATIRRHTNLPVAVGFGVSNPQQARMVARHCDAVVVGSAIVNEIAKGRGPRAVVRFLLPMIQAVKNSSAGPASCLSSGERHG
ncbi:MAG: tryptophan synthase subunit alpha [Verrucomicrobiae bacterium]|nr:tryptophan synthase subunit alpha [Verrucomicrobiae bacterium]